MSFKKDFIDKKLIKKVIDPGSPENSLFDSEKNSPIIPEVIDTPSSIIIQDIIETANLAQTEINSTLNDIYESNKHNQVFVKYYDLVQKNYWDPYSLKDNPNSTPPINNNHNEIKFLERKVYRDCEDPRAPFVQDLYNFKADSGGIKYAMESVWSEIIHTNSLYSDVDENNLFKFGLDKRRDRIELIRLQNERISNNTLDKIGFILLRALINKVFINGISSTDNLNNVVKNALSTLKQLRSVLYAYLLVTNTDWERFSDILHNIYKNLYNDIVVEKITSEAYSILIGIQRNVETAVLDLESAIDVDGILSSLETDITEIKDFEELINQFFVSNYGKIEQDLVRTKSIMLETEEASRIKVANSQKASKFKQILKSLDAAIAFVDSMRVNLSNASLEGILAAKEQLLKILQ